MTARSITMTRAAGTMLGDLLKELFSEIYQVGSYKLVNPDATARDAQIILGQPVKASSSNMVFVKATDEASTVGLVLWNQPVALGVSEITQDLYPVLRRGPAVINSDCLPAADVAGTAFTVATIVTALAALSPPIVAITDHVETSEQTT